MEFTDAELRVLLDAVDTSIHRYARRVKRRALDHANPDELSAQLRDLLVSIRQRIMAEQKRKEAAVNAAMKEIAGHRCHWCKQWVKAGESHECNPTTKE